MINKKNILPVIAGMLFITMIFFSLGFIQNKNDEQFYQSEQPGHAESDRLTASIYSSYIKLISEANTPREDYPEINEEDLPKFSDAVYKERLKNLSGNIDLSYNDYVRNFIDLYLVKRREQVERMVGLSYYYFPLFEKVLDNYNIPQELKNLAIIESALNPSALSPMGAAGIWQFMPATGREQGLDINFYIDERNDPRKSTVAAAKYLTKLYNIYGDWLLVIAAYNCGPGNVNRAIRRARGSRNIWSIYRFLPRETRGYVPAFIAANYVMTHYKDHDIKAVYPSFIQFSVDTVRIDQNVSVKYLSRYIGMTKEEVIFFNPSLKGDLVPGKDKEFELYLPVTKHGLFEQHKDKIIAQTEEHKKLIVKAENELKPKKKRVIHRVRRGDNLITLARTYSCSVRDIRRWNSIRGNKILIGQRLKIYTPVRV